MTNTVDPSSIVVGDRVRDDLGDLRPLRASIDDVGLLHPPVVTPGMRLVAGRRRLAALALDPAWDTVPVTVADTLDDANRLLRAENDENAHRLALSPIEAERMAGRLAMLYAVEAAARQKAGRPSADSAQGSERKTRVKAAKAVGLSHDTVRKIRAIREAAENEAMPVPARERARQAVETLSKAKASGKVSREYHETQAAVREAQAAERIAEVGDRYGDDLVRIERIDFRDLEVEAGSARMVFTDPPYPGEYLPMWAELGAKAAEWLAPGGMLMTYAPQKHLPRILDDLGAHLSWWWCYAVVHDGAWGKVRDRWVQCGWKPVLGFVKPGDHPAHRLPNDVQLLRRKEKSEHRWQQAQAEAEYWIEAYTEPGDLIVDPFAGSGTTIAAAKALGRRAIGCDIDPAAYVTAVERVS